MFRWLWKGTIALLAIVVIVIVTFFGWNSWTLNTAKIQLNGVTENEKILIFSECKKLIDESKENRSSKILTPDKAPSFSFLDISFVRYNNLSCEVFLYKVPGKGLGFSVYKSKSSEYEFAWFNDFESWDRHEIKL